MELNASTIKPDKNPEKKQSVFKGLLQTFFFIVVLSVTFFACTGRLNITMGWIYIAILLISTSIALLVVEPELIVERSEFGEDTKKWDIFFALFMGRIGPLSILVIVGLDIRFGWSPQIPFFLQMIGLGIIILSYIITDWAIHTNRFFSGIVRIQKERGHVVIDKGPYQFVRHPGYVGAMLYAIATPMMLSSLWGFVPVGIVVCITILRTALEDRTLQKELDGYKAYTEKVPYRLIPGVW